MIEEIECEVSLAEAACKENQIALEYYGRLTELTKRTYLYANSMQTPQRKIPFPDGGEYDHWTKCLPVYEEEQRNLLYHVTEMEQGRYPGFWQDSSSGQTGAEMEENTAKKLQEIEFELLSADLEPYELRPGESVFRKGGNKIIDLIPDLETDTHADDQGGLAVIYENAMTAHGCPPIHIHTFHFKKGKHEIYLGTGGFVIAGVIAEATQLTAKTGSVSGIDPSSLDWLYEK